MSHLTAETRLEYRYTIKDKESKTVYECEACDFEGAVFEAHNCVSEFVEKTGEYHSAEITPIITPMYK